MELVPGAYCNGATASPTYDENCYNYNEQSTCAPGSHLSRPTQCTTGKQEECFGGTDPPCKGISPSYVGGDSGEGVGTTYLKVGEIPFTPVNPLHQQQLGSTHQLGSIRQHIYATTEPESSSKTYLYVLGAVVVAVLFLVMFFMLKSQKSDKNK